jgi:WD40 repeat protein
METDRSSKPKIVQLQLSENVKRSFPERNLEITSDGKYLVQSGCWDNSFKFYNLLNGTVSYSIVGHSSIVTCLAFGDDGKTFVTSSS